MSRWDEEWRWDPSWHPSPDVHTISVIEAKAKPEPPTGARRVPFGFGVRDPEPVAEWEGNPS